MPSVLVFKSLFGSRANLENVFLSPYKGRDISLGSGIISSSVDSASPPPNLKEVNPDALLVDVTNLRGAGISSMFSETKSLSERLLETLLYTVSCVRAVTS